MTLAWKPALLGGVSCIALALAHASLPLSAAAQSTHLFSNSAPITIDDPCAGLESTPDACPPAPDTVRGVPPLTPASPYPSTIQVPASAFKAGSAVTDVNVTIKGITHGRLHDVDVLLVAPGGEYVLVLSNVGRDSVDEVAVQNLSWKFDDSAFLPLPRGSNNAGRADSREFLRIGDRAQRNRLYDLIYPDWVGVWTDHAVRTFKATDYDGTTDTDNFPLPAPQDLVTYPIVVAHNVDTGIPTITRGTPLSVFDGTNAVGTWSLYVADDSPLYDGVIAGGWELEIAAK